MSDAKKWLMENALDEALKLLERAEDLVEKHDLRLESLTYLITRVFENRERIDSKSSFNQRDLNNMIAVNGKLREVLNVLSEIYNG